MNSRIFTTALIFLLITSYYNSSFGQTARSSLTGKIIDSSNRQPLALATISVFRAQDTSLITFRMSTPDGSFKIPNLPVNELIRVIISYSGFGVYRNEMQLTGMEQKDLGTIIMAPDSKELEEVLVIAERPPVIIKNDTIEFNASAFKTLPTALVEDLLKKLPGVMVDASGNIMVNGLRVNRLLVDGKDFFGSDPKMATRNLPADIIEKVQVTEDKDEAELNPDKAKHEIGQVINLKLKKGIKKGWFGKAYAGAGSDDRHEAGAIVNLFKDTLQLSLVGFTNNLDKAGFSIGDVRTLGGFNRTGIESQETSAGRGLNVNGISFGGWGEGISTSTGAGFNMNHVFKDGLTLNTLYFYGHLLNDIHELNDRQQFLGDTVITTRFKRDEVQNTYNHRIGFGLKKNINKSTRFEFKPAFLISDRDAQSSSPVSTIHNFKGQLNEGINDINIDANSISYDHSLVFFKSFPKKGRSFNASSTLSYGHVLTDQINHAVNRFYDVTPPEDSIIDQLRDKNQVELLANVNANWNEPISKNFSLRLGYTLNVDRDVDELSTYNKDNRGKYEDYNFVLSNELKRTSWRNSIVPALTYNHKTLSATVGLSFMAMDVDNQFGKSIASLNQHYKYVLPGVNLRWKQLRLAYNMSVNLPSITDIQPVPDNTNPLYINFGNPDLSPIKLNNVNLNFTKNITHKYIYFTTFLNVSFRDNTIVRTRTVQPDGVQVTRPINVDGVYSIYHVLSFTRQHKLNKNLQFNYKAESVINTGRNFVFVNDRKSYVKGTRINPSVTAGLNWKDVIEGNMNYGRSFLSNHYETNDFSDLDINTSSWSGELVVRWPAHIVFETQVDYRYNSQVAPGISKTVTLWNAGINYIFLAKDKGQLKFSVFDLLKQNNRVVRMVSENYIQDRQLNALTRYFLLTFTYNIRDFKGGKVGGRRKFFYF